MSNTNPITWTEYVQLANRTAKPLEREQQLAHARMGIITEVGELTDLYKRHLIYGKDFDTANLKEEIGDICWYIALECTTAKRNLYVLEDIQIVDPVEEVQIVLTLGRLSGHFALEPSTELGLELMLNKLIQLCAVRGVSFNQCLRLNIAKLAERYGEKYSDQAALVRNLQAERALLEKA